MTNPTPPPLHGPSSKERRYDRQLRLWAASGQAALEEAHILLVNSGSGVVGIETLKNLVLPGVGQFTIVDPGIVTEDDLGVNFFLDNKSLGVSRSKRCCELLRELNPDVQGHYLSKPIDICLEEPAFLRPYTLIILTAPLLPSSLKKISQYANDQSIPLLYLHSLGFLSYFSVSLPSAFPIVDTHPEPTSTTDLRLLDPWPELTALAQQQTKRMQNMSDHDHGHIPYILLLIHHLEEWKEAHGGEAPQNYKEKSEFRELVRKSARTNNPEGGEENYDEAVGAVLKSLNPFSVGSAVREVLEADEAQNLTKDSSDFWLITSAIAQFVAKNQALPLPGSVPDMKAQSADYILLQNTYKSKARQDFAEVLQTVRATEEQLGRSTAIEDKDIEAYCKGAGFVKLIRGKPIQLPNSNKGFSWGNTGKSVCQLRDLSPPEKEIIILTHISTTPGQELKNPESLLPLYIVFLAYGLLYESRPNQSEHPDADSAQLETESQLVAAYAKSIVRDLFLEVDGPMAEEVETYEDLQHLWEKLSQIATEMVRAGGSELHNISALTGGMVAQEVIKIITKQYIPVDNICLFDGITSQSQVFRIG
ncbi:MAG: hypothetical protein M1837_003182 [Sclerophora amabilis]|nr:MAG: hypothetical protein M1837_003182 [Sclerophora amabilis]